MINTREFRLSSKRLASGRFQVHFSVGQPERFYGYVLAEPKTPLREVMLKIDRHLTAVRQPDRYFQRNLFSMLKRGRPSRSIVVFKSPPHAN
jgi:hypothetical protein